MVKYSSTIVNILQKKTTQNLPRYSSTGTMELNRFILFVPFEDNVVININTVWMIFFFWQTNKQHAPVT